MTARAATSVAAGVEKHISAQLCECSFVAVVAVSPSGRIVYANDPFMRAMAAGSPEELNGRDFRHESIVDANDWSLWTSGRTERGRSLRVKDLQGRMLTLSGDVIPIADPEGNLLAFGAFVPDVDAGRMDHLMQHAARMEAVAGMTTGIAHDFNNLLTVLVGNLYLIGEQLRDNAAAYAKVKAARDTAMRGADLTRQLLNFARDDEPSAKAVHVGSVIARLTPLIEKLVGSRILLKARTHGCSATVEINTTQLQSAIVNLVINARDAIDGHGNVLIDLKEATLKCENAFGLPGGRYVQLAVVDDGIGIPSSVIARVFEPFYTTKSADRGTGLGLSMVRWVSERARGRAMIRSEPGEGTVVTMILPVADAAADETSSRTMPLSVLPSGRESVLLSIGDGELRSMTQQSLAVLGYDVHVCSDRDHIDAAIASTRAELVLLDGALHSSLSGVIERVAGYDVKLLLLSNDVWGDASAATILRKPFSLVELATQVRRVLDGAEQ